MLLPIRGFLFSSLISVVISKGENVSPFDYVYIDIIPGYTCIVSASPCVSEAEIAITVFNKTTFSFQHFKSVKKDQKFQLDFENVLHVQSLDVNSYLPHDYRDRKLTVKAYVYGPKVGNDLVAEFPMSNEKCSTKPKNQISTFWNPHKEKTACDGGARIGEYSTLCIVNSSAYTPYGAYLLFADFCTVPFSFKVYAFTETLTHLARFTDTEASKTIEVIKNNKECGLHLYVNPNLSVKDYDVELSYACRKGVIGQILIRDIYDSELGAACPLHDCAKQANNTHQSCLVPWITAHQDEVNIKTSVSSFDVCKPHSELTLELSIGDKSKSFQLSSNHDITDKGKIAFTVPFVDFYDKSVEGFLKLNGGKISLFDQHFKDHIDVTVLRHFPTEQTAFPILRTRFLIKEDDCPKDSSKLGLMIGLPLVVLLIILIAVVIVVWWRKKIAANRLKSFGLPHHIQLGDDPEDIEDDETY